MAEPLARRSGAGPGNGHKRGDVGESNASRQARQHVSEVLDGVDVVERAGAEHGEGDGGALSTGVTAGEEKVLPRQCGTHVKALDDAIVDYAREPQTLRTRRCCPSPYRSVLELLEQLASADTVLDARSGRAIRSRRCGSDVSARAPWSSRSSRSSRVARHNGRTQRALTRLRRSTRRRRI